MSEKENIGYALFWCCLCLRLKLYQTLSDRTNAPTTWMKQGNMSVSPDQILNLKMVIALTMIVYLSSDSS